MRVDNIIMEVILAKIVKNYNDLIHEYDKRTIEKLINENRYLIEVLENCRKN